jgi:RNA polymerase sigma-70 factor, ECF subfamily
MIVGGELAVDVGSNRREGSSFALSREDEERIARVSGSFASSVFRTLRRLGVLEADADDESQKVFTVLARRLREVPKERERAFLLGTAARVAADYRRARRRRPESLEGTTILDSPDPRPSPEGELERKRQRETLDGLLAELPEEQRAVFVLFEIEELGLSEIAAALSLRIGTVASRLHRARKKFELACQKLEVGR